MGNVPRADRTYLVCGTKPWNRRVFDAVIRHYPGRWYFAASSAEMTDVRLAELRPRYAFFLHWSNLVRTEILDRCECICFHMADVPYGRGGSPLQNLIMAGHRETKLTALRMTAELDAGPVYLKEPISLEGNAEEIYIRSSELAARMILQIVTDELTPVPQIGEAVIFRRRKPADSEIPADLGSHIVMYDFIRMLDADGYPRAFLTHGQFRFEFSRVGLYDGRLRADVTITPIENWTP